MKALKYFLAVTAVAGFANFSLSANAQTGASILTTVVTTAQGNILGNAQGLSLYTFDIDRPGVSNCNGACAVAWPPVPITETTLAAPFGVITRQDGSTQLSINGKAVYLYVNDVNVGDILGSELNRVWHLIPIESLQVN